jgi:hypothetical protein
VTAFFLKYCMNKCIHVLVFLPHATHTLQLLNVVMFKPLATSHSEAFIDHTQKTQGLVPIQIADFSGLFWTAWVASVKKELILKAFFTTSIWPKNCIEILKRYTKKKPKHSSKLEETIDND